jgi:hypothetical protein
MESSELTALFLETRPWRGLRRKVQTSYHGAVALQERFSEEEKDAEQPYAAAAEERLADGSGCREILQVINRDGAWVQCTLGTHEAVILSEITKSGASRAGRTSLSGVVQRTVTRACG